MLAWVNKIISKLMGLNVEEYENIILFLCSNEALPNPMDAVEEEKCLIALKQGDTKSKNKLIEHNLRLVVYIAKKFENTNVELDDLISVGSIGLIKAVNTFDMEKKIKLATYASRCIENEILMHLRKVSKQKNEISLDKPLSLDSDGNELLLADVLGVDCEEVFSSLETQFENEMLHQVIAKLDNRDKKIMSMRFGLDGGEGKTQKEVADMMQISQSYISRIEKKILSKMKKSISKIN